MAMARRIGSLRVNPRSSLAADSSAERSEQDTHKATSSFSDQHGHQSLPSRVTRDNVLLLQRLIGNQAVQRLVSEARDEFRVHGRASPPLVSVQRDIRGRQRLAQGELAIDFKRVDARQPGENAGEEGTITFLPYPNNFPTESIELEQIHKVVTPNPADTTFVDLDYSRAELSFQQTQGRLGGEKGYVVDQQPREIKQGLHANPTGTRKLYQQKGLHYYAHTGAEIDENKKGSVRRGKNPEPAILKDTPSDNKPVTYTFMTAAHDQQHDQYMAEVDWGFEVEVGGDGKATVTAEHRTIREPTFKYTATAMEAKESFYNYWGAQGANPALKANPDAERTLQEFASLKRLVIDTRTTGVYPDTPAYRAYLITLHQQIMADINQGRLSASTRIAEITRHLNAIDQVTDKLLELQSELGTSSLTYKRTTAPLFGASSMEGQEREAARFVKKVDTLVEANKLLPHIPEGLRILGGLLDRHPEGKFPNTPTNRQSLNHLKSIYLDSSLDPDTADLTKVASHVEEIKLFRVLWS